MIAGGLHADIAAKYFRVGHMHISSMNATLGHIDKVNQPFNPIPVDASDIRSICFGIDCIPIPFGISW